MLNMPTLTSLAPYSDTESSEFQPPTGPLSTLNRSTAIVR